jgi:hypothetical protein
MRTTIPTYLIAPCGMNCRLCWGYNRDQNTCPGCLRTGDFASKKSKYRTTCKIKNCEQLKIVKTSYCSDRCDRFPCSRLNQLDKRYSKKYGMSMISNLTLIQEEGIRQFIRNEKGKWKCHECGELICVHKPACLHCGHQWNKGR